MKARLGVLLSGIVACGGASLPPIESVPEVPDRPDGTVAPVDRAVQQQAGIVHKMCVDRREALVRDVESAEAGDIGLISAATVAMVLGEAADGSSVEQLQQPTTDRIEAVPQQQPSKRLATDTRAAAEARMRDINTELESAQSFLIAHPDPNAWSEADQSAWSSQLDLLRALCR